MPNEQAVGEVFLDRMGTIALHLLEQLATLNRTLANIEEALRGIESRLSYAQVLDNND